MRRVIPCQMCREPACELELPQIDATAASMLRPLLRLAALKMGVVLDPKVENPLDGIDGPTLGELLAARCTDCAAKAVAMREQLHVV